MLQDSWLPHSIVDLYRIVHGQIRTELDGLDDAGAVWTPGPGTNSISVIITHMLGAEDEMLKFVRGMSTGRDRDAEFAVGARTVAELSARVDAADQALVAAENATTFEDLARPRTRPGTAEHPAAWWLLRNYGHTQLHLGHVQMTTQLYRQSTQR
jgi:DinB superfamily